MTIARFRDESDERVKASTAGDAAQEQVPAWEEIENGRYMPRRVRGSCLGRELG